MKQSSFDKGVPPTHARILESGDEQVWDRISRSRLRCLKQLHRPRDAVVAMPGESSTVESRQSPSYYR